MRVGEAAVVVAVAGDDAESRQGELETHQIEQPDRGLRRDAEIEQEIDDIRAKTPKMSEKEIIEKLGRKWNYLKIFKR